MKSAAITDDRIDHIVRMMLKRQWKGMVSREKLAEEWGCHEKTVGTMADRASAIVARRGQPIEQEIDDALAELEQIKLMALNNERCSVDKDGNEHYFAAPMLREATDAIKLKLEIRGVLTKQRGKEPAKPDVEDEYSKMTREQQVARLKEELAKLEAEGKDGMH